MGNNDAGMKSMEVNVPASSVHGLSVRRSISGLDQRTTAGVSHLRVGITAISLMHNASCTRQRVQDHALEAAMRDCSLQSSLHCSTPTLALIEIIHASGGACTAGHTSSHTHGSNHTRSSAQGPSASASSGQQPRLATAHAPPPPTNGSGETGMGFAPPSILGSTFTGPINRSHLYLGRTITKKTLLFRGLRLKVRLRVVFCCNCMLNALAVSACLCTCFLP